MNQRGFATLEVILMVVIIGILATVAVPRFTDVTTKANTAKIQSDLTTIDTSIQIYYMEKGSYPTGTSIDALSDYLMEIPKPPTGEAFIKGTDNKSKSTSITGPDYLIDSTSHRATLDGHTVGDFSTTKSE